MPEECVKSCGGTSEQGCPGCGQACGSVYECGAYMWKASFFQAMKEVQVDLLKAKIQKAWGPMMDKAADGMLEGMGAHWQSMLMQAKAKEDFTGLLRKLWSEAGKK